MVPNPALLEILTRVNSRESFSRGYSFSRYPVQVQIRNNIAGLSVGAAPSVDVSDLRHVGIHMGKDNFLEISTKKEGGLYLLG
ncbi:hypothetical protein KA107_03780, partial [Candidatus Pacearchaeota archaeon]|nr:hypothetical protein [Candidatus Pacearchaeota archaeon]